MASYHIKIRRGSKGKGTPHAEYIFRDGKYSSDSLAKYDDLVYKSSGNMPSWAESNPLSFWEASDHYERANGNVYREIEIALPRELNTKNQIALVDAFIKQHLGERHSYQFAIHCPKASLDGGDQPHAHIMYSERILDGIERAPDEFFKRYNAKNPELGGCKKRIKDDAKWIVSVRELWAKVQNTHLEKHGIDQRVDHRSLKDQGIDRAPENHLGAKHISNMTPEVKEQFLERRRTLKEMAVEVVATVTPEVIKEGVASVMAQFREKQRQQELEKQKELEKQTALDMRKRLEPEPSQQVKSRGMSR